MELFLLLLVPIVISVVMLIAGKGRITLKEFLVQELTIVLLIVFGFFLAKWTNTQDTEIWSGRVVKKQMEIVSCEHGYPCNCQEVCTGAGENETCWTHCDTCYEHDHDYDWNVYTSNEEDVSIDRIDRQGTHEPPRFTQVKIGDHTAFRHSFTNYIKANPWSIFRQEGFKEKFIKSLPAYPNTIYDYYNLDRFIDLTGKAAERAQWNKDLMEINSDLGAKKKVNIIIVATPVDDTSYLSALEEAWLGGKKNDLVIILGVVSYPTIAWTRVMSWSRLEELKIEIRDEMPKIGSLEKRSEIIALIKDKISSHPDYVRRNMEDFAYLKAEMRPPTWALILIFILGVALSIGLSIYFYEEDPFEDN